MENEYTELARFPWTDEMGEQHMITVSKKFGVESHKVFIDGDYMMDIIQDEDGDWIDVDERGPTKESIQIGELFEKATR